MDCVVVQLSEQLVTGMNVLRFERVAQKKTQAECCKFYRAFVEINTVEPQTQFPEVINSSA